MAVLSNGSQLNIVVQGMMTQKPSLMLYLVHKDTEE